jgi:hypothetical protein
LGLLRNIRNVDRVGKVLVAAAHVAHFLLNFVEIRPELRLVCINILIIGHNVKVEIVGGAQRILERPVASVAARSAHARLLLMRGQAGIVAAGHILLPILWTCFPW